MESFEVVGRKVFDADLTKVDLFCDLLPSKLNLLNLRHTYNLLVSN